jgi:ATP-dependent DNA helicase DinG
VALPAVAGLADRLEQDYPLYRQGQMPRKLLTEAFKAHGSAVLLGLKTYWEGVDVPGEALRLVIVHQFPFSPPDDPVWEALCSYITKRGGSWFRELALPTATIAIKQGVGRLIRRQTDYGVMVVLDGRATTAAYGDKIMACLPPAPVTRSLDAVAAFYAARRPDARYPHRTPLRPA